MKRFISMILAITMLLTLGVSLGGCSTKKDDTLTVGQWLGMINTSFGMESYSQDKPYIEAVNKDNEYFQTIQIAAEWGVIDSNFSIDPSQELMWKDALISLVNVGGFTKEGTTDDEKIEYAIDNFDKSIRKYWMSRYIDVSEASTLLVKAQTLWANRTYSEPIENVDYSDGVIVLADTNTQVIQNDPNTGTIAIKTNTDLSICKDDVFVIPATDNSHSPVAYRAKEVVNEQGITYIKTDDNLELGDFVDELYVENTYSPDFSTAEIYDGNGNLVQSQAIVEQQSYKNNSDYKVVPLVAKTSDSINAIQLAQKTTFSFETDACKVEVSMKKDGLSAKIEVPFSETWKGYYETEVSNFKVTNKIDYSWFTLHSAEVKVDYTTKNSIGIKKEFVKEEAAYAPKWSNGNGKFLTNLKNSVWKNKESGIGAKTIKLGSIKVASVGVASFSIDVIAKIKVDGTIEVSCTETGCKGIEYKNGNCRVINTSDKDTDVKFKCKAEGTVSVVPTVNAFGFAIIGFKGEVGLGAEASVTLHLADPENHLLEEMSATDISPEIYENTNPTGLTADVEEVKKLAEQQGATFTSESSSLSLHIDTCIDINVYFILKVGIEETTLAGKLLKGTKIKVEWELCGSKNSKICNIHVENFDFVKAFQNISFFSDKDQCTMKYVPFDGAKTDENTESTENIQNNNDISVGEVLTISTMNVVLLPNESAVISVTQIPKGYELKDVVCETKNSEVAAIDKNGVITAKGEGSTTIKVATSDGKYSCACSVLVVKNKDTSFTPLSFTRYITGEAYAA